MRVKQTGAFAVELALVLTLLSVMSILVINHMLAINKKGQLDRATYSLVTILAERKQLFNSNLDICAGDCRETEQATYSIATASLKRMIPTFDKSKFGMRIDEIRIDEQMSRRGEIDCKRVHTTLTKGAIHGCNFPDVTDMTKEKTLEMLPVTSRGRRLPLYQVSLCYETPVDVIGATTGEVFRIVSTSYAFARV
ncbi:tight adherence pilus pseudopilin TadF [Vibrio sp. NH-UV-68]|uniref:tight adherence pilus pseudopilin TadF n=1 Tax=unclassified Vibrio TaxID=2614977 RepID=UPI0036F3C2AC